MSLSPAPLQCDCVWFGLLFLTFLFSLCWLYIGLVLLNDLHNFNECVMDPSRQQTCPGTPGCSDILSPGQLSCYPSSLEVSPVLGAPGPLEGCPSLPSGPTHATSPQATANTPSGSPLRHLPLPCPRFLFRQWGRWMDWSLAFLLVISLLVTYASLLLVGPGATGLTPTSALPSGPALPLCSHRTTGGAGGGRRQPGKPA